MLSNKCWRLFFTDATSRNCRITPNDVLPCREEHSSRPSPVKPNGATLSNDKRICACSSCLQPLQCWGSDARANRARGSRRTALFSSGSSPPLASKHWPRAELQIAAWCDHNLQKSSSDLRMSPPLRALSTRVCQENGTLRRSASGKCRTAVNNFCRPFVSRGACVSGNRARLITHVGVLHLRRSFLVISMMQFVARQWRTSIFSTYEKSLVSSLCESEMSEMKERVCRCTMWNGRSTVSDHFPVGHVLNQNVLRRQKGIRATVSAQCMNALKNMRAVRCFSAPPAQIVKYSFIIMLSVSRSRLTFPVRWREWTGLPF